MRGYYNCFSLTRANDAALLAIATITLGSKQTCLACPVVASRYEAIATLVEGAVRQWQYMSTQYFEEMKVACTITHIDLLFHEPQEQATKLRPATSSYQGLAMYQLVANFLNVTPTRPHQGKER